MMAHWWAKFELDIILCFASWSSRKLAQKWHPDNFQDEDEKKKAEKKFMDIAAAKEVLTDEGWLFNYVTEK